MNAAYWRRGLALFVGGSAQLTFVDGEGRERTWVGQLLRLDDERGPIIDWQGEPRRLCAWEQLRAAESAA